MCVCFFLYIWKPVKTLYWSCRRLAWRSPSLGNNKSTLSKLIRKSNPNLKSLQIKRMDENSNALWLHWQSFMRGADSCVDSPVEAKNCLQGKCSWTGSCPPSFPDPGDHARPPLGGPCSVPPTPPPPPGTMITKVPVGKEIVGGQKRWTRDLVRACHQS